MANRQRFTCPFRSSFLFFFCFVSRNGWARCVPVSPVYVCERVWTSSYLRRSVFSRVARISFPPAGRCPYLAVFISFCVVAVILPKMIFLFYFFHFRYCPFTSELVGVGGLAGCASYSLTAAFLFFLQCVCVSLPVGHAATAQWRIGWVVFFGSVFVVFSPVTMINKK